MSSVRVVVEATLSRSAGQIGWSSAEDSIIFQLFPLCNNDITLHIHTYRVRLLHVPPNERFMQN